VLPPLPANLHFILSLTLESERYNFYVSPFNKAHLSIDDTERISALALQLEKLFQTGSLNYSHQNKSMFSRKIKFDL